MKKTKGLVATKSSPYVVGEDPKTRMRHQSLLLYFEQLQKVISLVDFHGFVISFVGFIRSDVLFDILKVCIFFDGFMVLFDLRFFFFFGVWLLPKMLSQNPLLQPTYFPQKKLIFSSLSQLIKHLVAKRISKRVAVSWESNPKLRENDLESSALRTCYSWWWWWNSSGRRGGVNDGDGHAAQIATYRQALAHNILRIKFSYIIGYSIRLYNFTQYLFIEGEFWQIQHWIISSSYILYTCKINRKLNINSYVINISFTSNLNQ